MSVGDLVMVLTATCFQTAKWYFLSLYLQIVLHYTPMQAGLAFLPHTLLSIVVLQLVAPLLRRVSGSALVVVGLALSAAGFVWQAGSRRIPVMFRGFCCLRWCSRPAAGCSTSR